MSPAQKYVATYRGADKSLARPGRKQARKHVRDSRDFNNIETRAVIKLFFLQGKAPKDIHAIQTETLACFLPGRGKALSATMYILVDRYSSFGIATHYPLDATGWSRIPHTNARPPPYLLTRSLGLIYNL